MLSRLSVVVCLIAMSAANPTEPFGDNSPRIWTVTLTAEVDGSGVFQFSDEALSYKHKHWGNPANVQINGHQWQDLCSSPEEWQTHRGHLDLTNAWVIRREGRDTIAFEKTKNGFSVFMNDSPNGTGSYSITIGIPLLAL